MRGGETVEDTICRRIRSLTESALERVASSSDGWSVLYRDPGDGRYWELT
jgi:hypothetical protein